MPENWEKYRLGDLIEVNENSIRKGDLDWINYIDIKSVGTGYYEEPKRMNFEDAPSRARRLLKEGDTVISSVRPNLKSYFYSQNLKENTIASTGFAVLTPKKINNRFLYYLTTNDSYINYLVNSCTGSAYPAFGPQVLLDSEVLIPESLQEQKSIASILSALDDKIELNLQMNKTLEEMALALYKHWFVDFGPFQDAEFVDSELGEIPKGWKNAILGDLVKLNPRLSLAKGSQASFVEMKVLPIDVMSVSDVAQKEFKGGAKFQNGDTLFARITPCLENGKTAFVDFLEPGEIAFGSTEFLVMRAKEGVSKYWTYCLARDTNFRNYAISTMVGTSGRQRVQNDPFLSYEIPQPPKEIFKSFSEIAEPWFTQIRINTIENITLTQLRDTLLPKLISGEVRVKEVEKTLTEVL